MRTALLWFGWLSIAGSAGDILILAMLGWLVATQGADPLLTVDTHLLDHLPFLYWVKDLALLALPASLVAWLFGLPALAYFPARIVFSVIVGALALAAARALPPPSGKAG